MLLRLKLDLPRPLTLIGDLPVCVTSLRVALRRVVAIVVVMEQARLLLEKLLQFGFEVGDVIGEAGALHLELPVDFVLHVHQLDATWSEWRSLRRAGFWQQHRSIVYRRPRSTRSTLEANVLGRVNVLHQVPLALLRVVPQRVDTQ